MSGYSIHLDKGRIYIQEMKGLRRNEDDQGYRAGIKDLIFEMNLPGKRISNIKSQI